MSKWNRPCRLKKEARPFFKEDLAKDVFDFDTWKETYNIDEKALEEVKEVFITYGHRTSEISSSLGGWANPENEKNKKDGTAGATFYFALHFPSCKFEENDKFSKGRMIGGLMDRIQRTADSYFTQFVSEELDDNGQEKEKR